MTSPKDREELKYAHLGTRETEARRANKEALAEHIASILDALDAMERD